MTSNNEAQSNVWGTVAMPKEEAIELLRRQIDRGKTLRLHRPIRREDYDVWETLTREALVRIFGADSPNVRSVIDIGKFDPVPAAANDDYWEERTANDLAKQISKLDSLVELLMTSTQEKNLSNDTEGNPMQNTSVFLVHGHNNEIKETVARFLEKLDLSTIVLHEQPNLGRTVIEKFMDYSNVGFAVILLTADDRGGIISVPYEGQALRARQNVIFELGFFLGKLSRMRVCALYQPGVELPSDYQGVLYISLDDSGAWRLTLARELKAAGLPVDLNKVF